MTVTGLPWLPPPEAGEVESALVRVVAPWLDGWMSPLGPLRARRLGRGEIRPAQWAGCSDAMVGIVADGRGALGNAVCAGHGDPGHAGDVAVLDELADRMLDDSWAFLADLCGTDRVGVVRTRTIPDGDLFSLAPADSDWAILLALSERCQIVLRKAAAGSGVAPKPASLREAFAPLRVGVGCHLGHAQLVAGDLPSLAKGDVIMLPGRPDAPALLTVDGHVCSAGKAFVTSTADGAEVRIVERPRLARKVG